VLVRPATSGQRDQNSEYLFRVELGSSMRTKRRPLAYGSRMLVIGTRALTRRYEFPTVPSVSGGALGTSGKRALAWVAVVLVLPTRRTYCREASLRGSKSQGAWLCFRRTIQTRVALVQRAHLPR
jgi:hypothetical protein